MTKKKEQQDAPLLTVADIAPGAVGSTLMYQLLDAEKSAEGEYKVPCIVQHAYHDGRRGPGGHLLVRVAIFTWGGVVTKDVELTNTREPGTADTIQQGDLS